MESHDKYYVDPNLNTKRGRYAEKESERYADDLMFGVCFFFLIKVLKDCLTNNKFVFTFMLFCCPSDCYRCISKL